MPTCNLLIHASTRPETLLLLNKTVLLMAPNLQERVGCEMMGAAEPHRLPDQDGLRHPGAPGKARVALPQVGLDVGVQRLLRPPPLLAANAEPPAHLHMHLEAVGVRKSSHACAPGPLLVGRHLVATVLGRDRVPKSGAAYPEPETPTSCIMVWAERGLT